VILLEGRHQFSLHGLAAVVAATSSSDGQLMLPP